MSGLFTCLRIALGTVAFWKYIVFCRNVLDAFESSLRYKSIDNYGIIAAALFIFLLFVGLFMFQAISGIQLMH